MGDRVTHYHGDDCPGGHTRRCECGHWLQPLDPFKPPVCVMGCVFQTERDRAARVAADG